MSTDIRVLRSTAPSMRPRVSDLDSGQPMANIESSDPGLYFSLDNGTLMKVGPSHVGPSAPNSSPAQGGQTGNSVGETWVDTSNSGFPLLKVYTPSGWLTVSTKGEVGQKGEKGQKGFKGEDSTVVGPKGSQGDQGLKGDQGTKGTKGIEGTGGGTGSKGGTGQKGEPGSNGTDGTKGEPGAQGQKGDTGSVPDLALGELSDVNVLLPGNRDRLVYNQLGSTWVAEAQFPDPDTGWSDPTGTSTKSTFSTSTVTVEELAERVKAIYEALKEVGLLTS